MAAYMGAFLEGLDDHEGYALRRLPDGTLTGMWTGATREFTAYLPARACGWRSPHPHPPTEQHASVELPPCVVAAGGRLLGRRRLPRCDPRSGARPGPPSAGV